MGLLIIMIIIIIIIIIIITIILILIIIMIIKLFCFLLHCMNEIHCHFSLFPGGLVIYYAVLGVLPI